VFLLLFVVIISPQLSFILFCSVLFYFVPSFETKKTAQLIKIKRFHLVNI
jgi:hypothetical protein